jgi:hypothetical protein
MKSFIWEERVPMASAGTLTGLLDRNPVVEEPGNTFSTELGYPLGGDQVVAVTFFDAVIAITS